MLTKEMLSKYITVLPSEIDKYSAFKEIVNNCSIFDVLEDKNNFLKAVIKREKLQSTGVGHGVAIAHGKIANLDKTYIALGLSDDGIYFDDFFPQKVKLVFLIASCPARQTEYVKALGSLLSWIHDEELRNELKERDFTKGRCQEFLEMFSSQNFIKP